MTPFPHSEAPHVDSFGVLPDAAIRFIEYLTLKANTLNANFYEFVEAVALGRIDLDLTEIFKPYVEFGDHIPPTLVAKRVSEYDGFFNIYVATQRPAPNGISNSLNADLVDHFTIKQPMYFMEQVCGKGSISSDGCTIVDDMRGKLNMLLLSMSLPYMANRGILSNWAMSFQMAISTNALSFVIAHGCGIKPLYRRVEDVYNGGATDQEGSYLAATCLLKWEQIGEPTKQRLELRAYSPLRKALTRQFSTVL
jgi:hypothetical protein